MPPVTAFFDGQDYWLADGFHRFAARRLDAYKDIAVDVRRGSVRDATLFACGANITHGLPLSREDKRAAVTKLVTDDEWKTWSDRMIAKVCGVTHPFVANPSTFWRKRSPRTERSLGQERAIRSDLRFGSG